MYGEPPFRIAVVHGGPGAGGEMAPVARELARDRGVLEPIQTATSLEGQVDEVRCALEKCGDPPIVLIGFSWGAWLGFILAGSHPILVEKLILVSSGPFEERYAKMLYETRVRRLGALDGEAFDAAISALNDPATEDKDAALTRLGALSRIADTFSPIDEDLAEAEVIGPRADVFQGVWQEAARLRRRGALLALGEEIRCPVVAIHGDYDPHPARGVEAPLSMVLEHFRFILLPRCGHKPWIERHAKDRFFEVLKSELS
jgi:pimeloyl-ACP methyl ester carboxylesterase